MYLSDIPQCTAQNRNVPISVPNGAPRDVAPPSPGPPLVVSTTPSARRRLVHRLKATSRGRKWAQIASFSRKMSPPAFSRRCQAPPGGETAQMTRHGVTREGWQGATARMTTSRLRCKHRYHLLAGDTLISSRCGAADKRMSCTTTWWQSVVIYYTCVNQVVSDDMAPNSVRQSAATMWDVSYHVTQISLTRMSIHRSMLLLLAWCLWHQNICNDCDDVAWSVTQCTTEMPNVMGDRPKWNNSIGVESAKALSSWINHKGNLFNDWSKTTLNVFERSQQNTEYLCIECFSWVTNYIDSLFVNISFFKLIWFAFNISISDSPNHQKPKKTGFQKKKNPLFFQENK